MKYLFLLFLLLLIFLIYVFAYHNKNRSYSGPVTDHFDGIKFFYPGAVQPSFLDFLKWMASRKKNDWPDNYAIKPSKPKAKSEELKATFVNHSTVLIQWQGVNILTDPIWSERASPFSWIGPKRVHEPGIDFENLPKIDIVLISHNHYDHLDLPTLKALQAKYSPLFLTGLGNASLLKANGIINVRELDWWQSMIYKQIAITFTPARHFSARWPWDRNETLFGGFVISSENKHLFFAGDTGYGDHFKQIRDKFGNMELSFLPIGAFEPRWFMKNNHMSPLDAIQAHDDLGSETSIGIHYGTFRLSDESIDKPANLIKEYKEERHFLLLKPGQSFN